MSKFVWTRIARIAIPHVSYFLQEVLDTTYVWAFWIFGICKLYCNQIISTLDFSSFYGCIMHVHRLKLTWNRDSQFKKERFALNFLTPQNVSKFVIFMEKENQCSFFRFKFRATLSLTQDIYKVHICDLGWFLRHIRC